MSKVISKEKEQTVRDSWQGDLCETTKRNAAAFPIHWP